MSCPGNRFRGLERPKCLDWCGGIFMDMSLGKHGAVGVAELDM